MLKRTLMAFATLALLAGTMPLLSACNTTEGVGEDLEATGAAIDEAAEEAQE
jgi:predicted small secreted protein